MKQLSSSQTSLIPLFQDGNIRIWSAIIAITFLILALLNSSVLSPLNKIWFRFGILLGMFISPIIMGLVFYIVVTPISLIIRGFGKDVLNLKKKNKKTYWIEKPSIKNNMNEQF